MTTTEERMAAISSQASAELDRLYALTQQTGISGYDFNRPDRLLAASKCYYDLAMTVPSRLVVVGGAEPPARWPFPPAMWEPCDPRMALLRAFAFSSIAAAAADQFAEKSAEVHQKSKAIGRGIAGQLGLYDQLGLDHQEPAARVAALTAFGPGGSW